jgi:hypothetical protein
MRSWTRLGTGILGVIALASSLVFGQGFSAAISGSVRDASGAVIPQAAVSARNIETGQTRITETGPNGNYNLAALPVGPYEVTVEKTGFRQLVRSGISLTVGQEAVLNLTLEVGQVTQTVEVTGEAPLVNTTLSPTSGLINEGQIKDLPLNGRSFDQLLTLNVGTVNNQSNSGWSSSFSVAGKRTETNRFTINGVDYVGDNPTGQFNAPSGTSGQLLGVDAVREYNVVGHTYGAEYGKRAGGQITVVTSSGTNQLHGTVFEYLRNNKLDARNFFTTAEAPAPTPVPPFKRNQFGGSLGGPIKRDKMFVFGNYEGFRERKAIDTVGAVPNAQARLGSLPCNVAYPDATGTSAAAVAARAARLANCGTELAGLNAYLPAPNLARGILPFMAYWPEANGADQADKNGLLSGGAFSVTTPGRKPVEDFGSGRFDYNISSADSVSSNLTVDRGTVANPTENPIITQNDTQNLYALSGQETHIFSPTMLGIGTFGYSHASSSREATSAEPFPENLLLMSGEGRNNAGAFTLGGGSGTAQAAAFMVANGANLLYNNRDIFSGSYDVSITRGIHNLKMGVWAQKIKQASFSSGQNNAGTAQYAGLLTFLQDKPTNFSAAPNPIELQYRTSEAAWYFQDELKLRPNLTVRVGIRDEMTTGWNERNGRASNYLADPSGTILTNPLVGRSALIENHAIALWQPRVGVAWDPTGTGSWAVRAGFGIHNDLQDNLGQRLSANPPFAGRVQFSGVPLLSVIPIPSTQAPPPQCQTLAEAAIRPAVCASYAPGGIDPVLHSPTVQQWSLEIERAITQDLAVTIGYVGSEAYHTAVGVDMNSKQPVVCEDAAGCRGGTVPQGADYTPAGLRRPNPLVASTQGWFYFGTSSYHALNLSLTKRSRGGLMFKTNYSWAKVLDLDSGLLTTSAQNEASTIVTRFKPLLSHGVTSYSLLHQFNTNVSYQLPFGRGKAIGGGATGAVDKIIGGWQLNSIFNAQGGFPITPLAGQNQSDNGDSRNSDTPNLNPAFTGNPILGVDGFKKTGFYLDTNAFVLGPLGMYGNAGRGAFRGPGLVALDLSLFKRIPLTEQWNLQFRAEAFNILNHANFKTPDTIIFTGNSFSGNAGRILETSNSERQIQFALRLEF